MDAIPVHLYYNHRQLLQAENEYNKAALLPETLDEYKQVLDRHRPEKTLLKLFSETTEIRGQTSALDECEYVWRTMRRPNPAALQGCLELCRWKWNLLKMQDATTAINHAE